MRSLPLMLLFAGIAATPASAAMVVQFEAPAVQSSMAVFDVVGVETFETRTLGLNGSFSTDFGTGGAIVATYTGGRIDNANQFGSAGGTGRHIVTFSNLPAIEINFTTTLPQGLNYFGYWLSALDGGNRLEFFNGATSLGIITPALVSGFTGACPASPYCGNPNAPFLGQNSREPYAFLNIYFTNGMTYDRIRIYQIGGGGYESDNHTVGYFLRMSGIPEPATWGLMIAGFGLVGYAARRRRAVAVSA